MDCQPILSRPGHVVTLLIVYEQYRPYIPGTHLHGRDLARNREVHELVADLDRQPSHQSRVHLRLEDDRLVRAHLVAGNKKKHQRMRE